MHTGKSSSTIRKELVDTEIRAGHGNTAKILGVDAEWGRAKSNYDVWFPLGRIGYVSLVLMVLAVLWFAVSMFPTEVVPFVELAVLLASVCILIRDVWNGWIGVPWLEAVLAVLGIAVSWSSPVKVWATVTSLMGS